MTDRLDEKDRIIEALTKALARHVLYPLLPLGTRVHVGSMRSIGTVVGADGVDGEALAVMLDAPYPRGYEDGLCCASLAECAVVTPPGGSTS